MLVQWSLLMSNKYKKLKENLRKLFNCLLSPHDIHVIYFDLPYFAFATTAPPPHHTPRLIHSRLQLPWIISDFPEPLNFSLYCPFLLENSSAFSSTCWNTTHCSSSSSNVIPGARLIAVSLFLSLSPPQISSRAFMVLFVVHPSWRGCVSWTSLSYCPIVSV